jgi:rifampicin phosphotransferase
MSRTTSPQPRLAATPMTASSTNGQAMTTDPHALRYTLPLRALGAADLAIGGGKAVNLGRLLQADLPVPDSFCVTTEAYRVVAATDALDAVISELASLPPDATDRLASLAGQARAAILATEMPPAIAEPILAAYRQLGGPKVAVRSSATAEDLPSASFAGQQDTYLNIVGETSLLDAVRRCWASLWTDRAVAYRAANEVDHGAVRLAVVVQTMAPASVAGVLFTANPLTGHRGQMVADASPGLGEAVVSGAVNPDHWILDAATGRAIETRLGDKRLAIRPTEDGGTEHVTLEDGSAAACLDAEQLRILADLGRRVQALFEAPQDIEFAFVGHDDCQLVQARPITTLYPLPASAPADLDELRVYFSVNVAQGVFRPITPMGLQVWRLLAGSLATAFGKPPTDPLAGPGTLQVAGHRAFLDVTPALRHPVEARTRALAAELAHDPRLAVRGSAGPLVKTILRTALRYRVPGQTAHAMLHPVAARQRALASAQAIVEQATPAGNMDAVARLDQIEQVLHTAPAHLWFDLLPVAAVGFLARAVAARLLGDLATDEDLEAIVRAVPNNPTTEMDLALWKLAQRLRRSQESVAVFANSSPAELAARYQDERLPASLQQGLTEFLAAWGSRGVAEIDLGLPRWSDDPTHILGVLANYLRLDDLSRAPDILFAEAAVHAEVTVERLAHEAGGLRGKLAAWLLARTRELVGLREWPKFAFVALSAELRASLLVVGAELAELRRMERAEDIFFVTLSEAREGIAGRDLRSLVATRREEYRLELGRRHIPRLLLSDGTEPMPATPAHLPDGALVGTAASSGVVRGRARVILDPVGAHLEPGEILVAPSTDPGWTPLFLTAAGLVMEMGGAMSHGSVVAREYGIPAVVGVDSASTHIQTGQLIEVDGGSGTVRIIADPM